MQILIENFTFYQDFFLAGIREVFLSIFNAVKKNLLFVTHMLHICSIVI